MEDQNIKNSNSDLDSSVSDLEELGKKANEYLNGWKRTQADFINYKKEEARRVEDIIKFANESVLLEIIEVLDDLEIASKEVKNSGLDQVVKKFQDFLGRYGVQRIQAAGIIFDPLLHEALITEPEGTKIEEVRSGYILHDKVIRPARVKIVKE